MSLQIAVSDISTVEKQIQVTIPSDMVEQELDKYYLNLRRSAKIKGFRPGKVPRSILERFYGKQANNEVIANLINETFQEAIKEKNIQPVAPPIVDNDKFERGSDFTYTARIEVHPAIELKGDYLGLEAEQEKLEVTEADVDKYLEQLRELNAQLKVLEPDRPIRDGDFVVIDFLASIEGVPVKGGPVKDKLLEITPDAFLPGFTKQLVGLRSGANREIVLDMPEDYQEKELAGKKISFQVSIKEIKEKIVPALDDNFSRDMGEFETMGELREHVQKELIAREEQRIRNALYNSLMKQIIEGNPFDVPPSLIEKQTASLISEARSRLVRQGLQMDSSTMINRELSEAYRPMAEMQVKRAFILEEIAKKEGIEVAPSELKEYLDKVAATTGHHVHEIADEEKRDEANNRIKSRLLEEKTLAFLAEKAKIRVAE